MPPRRLAIEIGAERGRTLSMKLAAELRRARIDRGLSQGAIAGAVGLSRSRVSTIERGLATGVGLAQWSQLLASVGLELTAHAFPGAAPIRDAGHAALLGRLRGRLHRSLIWRTEVPMPIPGDLRAWDGMIRGEGWWIGVEAETRPGDLQALERRIALKQRDSDTGYAILLLQDSRRNRALVRTYAAELVERFSVPGSRALELLHAGVHPGGSSVILL